MQTEQHLTNALSETVPEDFEFYSHGRVEARATSILDTERSEAPLSEDSTFMGYQIHSVDAPHRVAVILEIPKDKDESMYTELGNILSSKLADALNAYADQSLALEDSSLVGPMVSPPRPVQYSTVKKMLDFSQLVHLHHYQHILGNQKTDLKLLMIPQQAPNSGTKEGTHV